MCGEWEGEWDCRRISIEHSCRLSLQSHWESIDWKAFAPVIGPCPGEAIGVDRDGIGFNVKDVTIGRGDEIFWRV